MLTRCSIANKVLALATIVSEPQPLRLWGPDSVEGLSTARSEAVADEEWSHFDAFPDLTLEPDQIVADDGTVAVRWTATGTHEGDLRGISPTGTRVEYQLMGMFRVDDGSLPKCGS